MHHLMNQGLHHLNQSTVSYIRTSAYNQTKEAQELYAFVKTLETYHTVVDSSTTLVLTTESELYQLMNGVDP